MTNRVRTTISGRSFSLDARDVEKRMRSVLPDPVVEHYAVVAGRRFPPKQVLAEVTGLDRADFTTHQARNVLQRLGFTVGRRSSSRLTPPPRPGRERWPQKGFEAETLRPFAGRWVAQRGLEVLVAAETPREVIGWLNRHAKTADMVFQVPAADDTEIVWVE